MAKAGGREEYHPPLREQETCGVGGLAWPGSLSESVAELGVKPTSPGIQCRGFSSKTIWNSMILLMKGRRLQFS